MNKIRGYIKNFIFLSIRNYVFQTKTFQPVSIPVFNLSTYYINSKTKKNSGLHSLKLDFLSESIEI